MKKNNNFNIILFLMLTLTGNVVTYESRVLELSDKFLDFRHEGMWLVKFYAPWCGHCKRLEPIFGHVAQALYNSPVRVAKVDCTRFPTVANAFKISGYPTIIFIRGEQTHVYQGDRKTEDIVEYAKRMSGPAVKYLQGGTCKTAKCALNESSVVFAYVGNQEGPLWDAYNTTAFQYQSLNIFYVFNYDEAPSEWKLNHAQPFVAVKKEMDEDFFQNNVDSSKNPPRASNGNLTKLLSNWIEKERFPTFIEITRGNFQNLMDTSKFIVMAVVEQDKLGRITQEMTDFKNMVQTVVLRNKEKYHRLFQFGWLGTPSLANSLAMDTLRIPSLFVLNSSSFQHHIPLDESEYLTVGAIEIFLESVLNGSAQALGGRTFGTKLYRAYYESKTGLVDMWTGNPVLTAVIFGLPFAFLSLICYSICCADFMDASDDDEPSPHEKRD